MNQGTDAKEIVFTFFELTNQKPNQVPRYMAHAKRLLNKYTKEDILYAIEMNRDKMYSLGFLTEENMGKAIVQRSNRKTYDLMQTGGESVAERNRAKLQRVSNQSRLGERDIVDLFKELK